MTKAYKYPKPTVGQTVWFVPSGDLKRYGQQTGEAIVKEVGSKYFYIQMGHRNEEQIFLEDWRTKGYDRGMAYPSEQAIADEEEREQILAEISNLFDIRGRQKMKSLTLGQVRRIKQIIDNP
jgi:hypothetical protein